jgi:hypothetical protein
MRNPFEAFDSIQILQAECVAIVTIFCPAASPHLKLNFTWTVFSDDVWNEPNESGVPAGVELKGM